MQDSPPDFGTGLRAHLGLQHVEPTQLDVALARAVSAMEPVVAEPLQEPDHGALEALAALESELLERERELVTREAALAGRAEPPRLRAGAPRRGSGRRPDRRQRRARPLAAAEERRGLTLR